MLKKIIILIVLLISFKVVSQNNVIICWDNSLSMNDRKIQKEFDYLKNYFLKHVNIEVTLLTFNNTNTIKNNFHVENGNWDVIKDKLQNVLYDGATSYRDLTNHIAKGDILLFTDGKQNYDEAIVKFKGKLHVINANESYDNKYINSLTQLNDGTFVNLMKVINKSGSRNKTYYGKIYSQNKIITDVNLSIENSNNVIKPNKDGSYKIDAKLGDVLVFSSNGKKIAEKKLEDNKHNNIWIDNGEVKFDEVTVTGKKNKISSDNMVTTGYGKQKKESLGYAVQTVKGEDLPDSATTVSDAVNGKFTGLKKGTNDDLSQSVIRGATSINLNNYALIIVDGAPIDRSSSAGGDFGGSRLALTDFVDPSNIADITVLKGLAATNRYGSEGSNGVILITTKTGSYNNNGSNTDTKNTALAKNNIYKKKVNSKKQSLITPYLSELNKKTNFEEAYRTYLDQRIIYWDEPFYFIDVFDFFVEENEKRAHQILSNIVEQENSSIIALRGLLFKANPKMNTQLTLNAANIMLKKFPEQIQSYLDVALANKKAGNYQKSLDILLGIVDGTINSKLNFFGLQKIAENEIRHLISKKRSQLKIDKIPKEYLSNLKLDARIIFDWNNPEAEFELQFVNPTKRFFKWKHSQDNSSEIVDELKNGYSQKEFEIEGGEKGEWIINVKYLGNRSSSKTPTLLKCTVQHNFGKSNQRDEEHIIRLYKKGSEEQVVKFRTR